MKHYVCKGECGGVSEYDKTCDAQSCSRFGKNLEECNCTDGKHGKGEEKLNG